jgi:hypothetical protein
LEPRQDQLQEWAKLIDTDPTEVVIDVYGGHYDKKNEGAKDGEAEAKVAPQLTRRAVKAKAKESGADSKKGKAGSINGDKPMASFRFDGVGDGSRGEVAEGKLVIL